MISKEEFEAALDGQSASAIRDLVESETTQRPKGRTRQEVLDSAFEIYRASEERTSGPSADDFGGGGDDPPPPEAPACEPCDDCEPEAPPVDNRPLQYEARSRTGRAFHKGGRVFGPAWERVGILTQDERDELDKFASFVQYRPWG